MFFKGNGFIVIYTAKFSTYAIGYADEKKEDPVSPSPSSGPTTSATPSLSPSKSSGSSGGGGGGGGASKTTPAKPSVPVLESRTDTTITVKTVAGQVYSIDKGATWQASGTFIGLTPEKEYSIITKIAATTKANESPVSDALKVTTERKQEVVITAVPSLVPTMAPSAAPSTKPTVVTEATASPSAKPKNTATPVNKVTTKEKEQAKLSLDAGLNVVHKGTSVKVQWGRVDGADFYKVYAGYLDGTYSLLKTVKSSAKCKLTVKKLNGKKLSATKSIKVYVTAYRKDGTKNGAQLAKSIIGYVTGKKNTRYTNVKQIKLKKTSYTLKKGKSAKIKAEVVLEYPKKKQLSDVSEQEFRYASTNSKIASVSGTGKIKAKKKGSCIIYIYARNGLAEKVKVQVK